MHSFPSVVRFFQIGELNLSLGVSELSYMLEITYRMHIGFFGKGHLKLWRLSHLSTESCSAGFFSKVEQPYGFS